MRRISIFRDIRHDRNGGQIGRRYHRGPDQVIIRRRRIEAAALRAREFRVRSLVRINRDPCEIACSASWLFLDQLRLMVWAHQNSKRKK